MATKQETNIVQNNNGFNLIDAGINNLLYLHIKDMFENKKFTYSTAAALVCMLYMQDIRDCAKEVLTVAKNSTVKGVSGICSYMSTCFRQQEVRKVTEVVETFEKNTANIVLDVKSEEYLAFISSVMSLPNTMIDKDMANCHLKNGIISRLYNTIRFTTDKFTGIINNIRLDTKDDSIISYDTAVGADRILFGTITSPKCLTDLIKDDELKEKMQNALRRLYIHDQRIIEYQYDAENDKYTIYNILAKGLTTLTKREIYDIPDMMWLALGFHMKLNGKLSINPAIVSAEILLIFAMGYDCGFQVADQNTNFYIVDIKIMTNNSYKTFCVINTISLPANYLSKHPHMNLNNYRSALVMKLEAFMSIYKAVENIDLGNKIETKSVSIKLLGCSDDVDLPVEFQKFYNDIVKLKKNTHKISIYQLIFDRQIKTNSAPNPEYTQRVVLIKHVTDENKAKLLLADLPPATITTDETIIELKSSKINECSKSFDTLYLRHDDKELLMNMLYNFCNSMQIYKEFEIPHKLGILLYGEPGTGKSTTIKTIASYAKRNIYYVDLKNINTNAELKQLFDYVIKECTGDNIIVFEDIDCMTDIVKPRIAATSNSSSSEEFDSISNALRTQNDNLTLSYLLNLLDGTLCVENTMFIMTTNHINNLDPALVRQGRVDVKMELKKADHYQIECMYAKIIGKSIDKDLLKRIPEGVYTPVDIIHHLIHNKIRNNTNDILAPFMTS